MHVLILRGNFSQLGGSAFESDAAIAQHDELGFVGLVAFGLLKRHVAPAAYGNVFRDEERIAQLMGDEDRADASSRSRSFIASSLIVRAVGGSRPAVGSS